MLHRQIQQPPSFACPQPLPAPILVEFRYTIRCLGLHVTIGLSPPSIEFNASIQGPLKGNILRHSKCHYAIRSLELRFTQSFSPHVRVCELESSRARELELAQLEAWASGEMPIFHKPRGLSVGPTIFNPSCGHLVSRKVPSNGATLFPIAASGGGWRAQCVHQPPRLDRKSQSQSLRCQFAEHPMPNHNLVRSFSWSGSQMWPCIAESKAEPRKYESTYLHSYWERARRRSGLVVE